MAFLLVHGHSLALGAGASDQERRRFTRPVADRLGLRERNRAVGGAIAHWSSYGDVGDGGYPAVLQEGPVGPVGPPFLPPGSAGLLYYGANDLAVLGRRLRPYREALRAMISRYRSAAVFEAEDPANVTAPEGWEVVSGRGDCNSGEGYLETRASEATATIELPEDFPGGTVAIGFTADPATEATASFTIDGRDELGGRPIEALDLTGPDACFAERRNALVKRLVGVSAETRQIEVRVSVGSGVAILDYWQLEADPPPPVGVLTQFPLANYDLYAGWPAHPLSDADVTEALNPATREVVAEFDSRVGVIEIEDAFEGGYAVSWDCYPDDAGYARLAEAVHPQLADLVGRAGPAR